MRKEMFINKEYNHNRYGFEYLYLAKAMFNREEHYEKNKHRDSRTC